MIRFEGVGKTYAPLFGPRTRAVDEMSFTVGPGEVFGIAGPNGAGKSTMIAMMLGFLHPSQGTVAIEGQAPRAYVQRHGIGYVSELVAVHPRWRARETLVRMALLGGLPDSALGPRVDEAIALMGLEEHAGKRTSELSKGTLQRLGIAQALLREDRVMIFDEPTHGLDPLWTQRFRDLVPAIRRADRAIVVASHNLDELERLADRVAIVDRGRLQRIVNTRAGADGTTSTRYRIAVRGGEHLVAELFPGASPSAPGEFAVPVTDLASLNRALAALLGRGALVVSVAPSHSSLEEHFRQVVEERA